MSAKRISNVLRKEWAIMMSSAGNLFFLFGIPLLLVGQAIFLAWIIPAFVSPAAVGLPAEAGSSDALRMLILGQFHFFVLLIPAMVANVIATLTIVEEKLARTLEPLLATPVRTWELLSGKILSGALPALAIAWASVGAFVGLCFALGWGDLLLRTVDASWWLSIFLLTPAIALLSFILGVIGSSRAADVKSAQNLAVVVVLPIFALIGVQVTGVVRFTPVLTLLVSAGLAAVDAWLVWLAVRLFARESIVIRWR